MSHVKVGQGNAVTSDQTISTSMSDHCSEMMQDMTAEHLPQASHDNPSATGDCCQDTCQCSLGVCSSPLFHNAISITSVVWASQPEFIDSQASIVRLAASLYRPPITA